MLSSVSSSRPRRQKRPHNKKEKKLIKLIKNDSETDGDESEHELSFYMKDRVKLMKEVLKIIKPKKIRSMAPDCMSGLDNEEINSRLLEELLGISDKRLKYIFTGQNLNEDSSSTDPEAEDETIDLISLDDISDGDLVIDLDSDEEKTKKQCRRHKMKIKEEHRKKKVKKERSDKHKSTKNPQELTSNKTSEENLMSVLELLELQARARAIKSQLVLEKQQEQEKQKEIVGKDSDNDNDAVIVESPRNDEIIISSSDGDDDQYHISKSREEPVDFWCGTREKNNDMNEQVEENVTDHIYQYQQTDGRDKPDKVNEKVVVQEVTTTNNNSDSQTSSNFNQESEMAEVRDIPLPESDKEVECKSMNNDEDETKGRCRNICTTHGSDISEGEVQSTDDKTSENNNVDGDNESIEYGRTKQNEDTSKAIDIQNVIEIESIKAFEDQSKVTLDQKEDAVTQQAEESIKNKSADQKIYIEKLTKDPEEIVEKSIEDNENKLEKLETAEDMIEKESVGEKHGSEGEYEDQKIHKDATVEHDNEQKNKNVGNSSNSQRKSKRLSSKLITTTSSETNETSSKTKFVEKKKLSVPKKSKKRDLKRENIERGNSSDDEERIVLDVEQSELDSVNLD